jgi:RHS repeat-associated protein
LLSAGADGVTGQSTTLSIFGRHVAGNLPRVQTGGGGGYRQVFDTLNRVTQRIVDAKTYARQYCEGFQTGPETGAGGCLLVFPAYPNDVNGALTIPADTAWFTYDAAGNMIAADNGDAKVHRRYYPNGALKVDSSWARVPDGATFNFGHLNVLEYFYDLSGRRDSLRLPNTGLSAPFRYTYDTSVDGSLATITDPYNTPYRYVYDAAGRVDSIVINGGDVREKRWYDWDHRQSGRQRTSTAYGSLESFSYDAQGKIKLATFSTSAGSYSDETRFVYSGLGAVLVRDRRMTSSTNWEIEEFRVDGLGNVWRNRSVSSGSGATMALNTYYGIRGAMNGRKAEPRPLWPQESDSLKQLFDADGHLVTSHQLVWPAQGSTPTTDTPTRHYYALDGKLRAVQRHNQGRGTWEEYRYDALGRRVMVIARMSGVTPGCSQSGLEICNPLCTIGDCEHKVTWQLWDGDQLIREDRRAYPDNGTPNVRYGTVHYVHGLELDHPLAVLDGRLSGSPRILNRNWRGTFEASVTASGAAADCSLGGSSCSTIPWPASGPVYGRISFYEPAGGEQPHTWSGTLLLDQQDGTGSLYRRNRYYDPVAGRFTQEDPIGLAGGMNLYGFASGDPVTYSDPFGLSGCKKGEECPTPGAVAIALLKESIANVIDAAVDVLGSLGNSLKEAMPGLAAQTAGDLALAAIPVVGEVRTGRRVAAVAEATGKFLSESRHIRGINEARKDFARIGATADEVSAAVAKASGWESIAAGGLAGGRVCVGRGVVQYTMKNIGKETVMNVWIP